MPKQWNASNREVYLVWALACTRVPSTVKGVSCNFVIVPLQINGKDLSGLTSQDVLALLTGPEKQISLLLFREPSVTLL